MAIESLEASQAGIKKAKRAMTDKGLTQERLEQQLQIAHATVSKFFTGQPVKSEIFVNI
jgi:transcriptional regulator with XRE-family HTH domain